MVRFQRTRAAVIGNLPVHQHISPIDNRQNGFGMVLDNDHGDAATQPHQRVHHFLHHGWRQSFERFVEQDQLTWHGQCAGDRQHLAFAA